MNKYLSLIFLYSRASRKKILILAGAIPVGFLAIFLLRIGNPFKASGYMLMESAFGGVWAVLLFLFVLVTGMFFVANSLNGKMSLKATTSTTGFTIRRLRISPISSYLTVFVFYTVLILIFWGIAIASLYLIGKTALAITGTSAVNIKFALGLLRTNIGYALVPTVNPALIAFNVISVLALGAECAKSCYLSWHNGRPSFGAVLVIVSMFLVWNNDLESIYMLMAIVIIAGYTSISFWDMVFREKHPKGDPFKANQYAGVMDLDSFEFDESSYKAVINTLTEDEDPAAGKKYMSHLYADTPEKGIRSILTKLNPLRQRRRFLPIGINMERADRLFGGCIFLGIAEHSIFLFRYYMKHEEILASMKGVTIANGLKMPYFWDMQTSTYYGYIFGILLVIFLQAYWNHEYYNKKTQSVYVMKRLPNRKEYARTIWVAPAIQAGLIAMIMIFHTVVDMCIYVGATPEIALYADYQAHLLPF